MENIISEIPICFWKLLNNNELLTPIPSELVKTIEKITENSLVILEMDKYDRYKISIFKEIDLIVTYQIDKFLDIPSNFNGSVIIHSTKKINKSVLKRKGFKVIKSFEHTSIAKYHDLGLLIYLLEGKPWYLKSSDFKCNELNELFKIFKKKNYLKTANYYTTLILERNK